MSKINSLMTESVRGTRRDVGKLLQKWDRTKLLNNIKSGNDGKVRMATLLENQAQTLRTLNESNEVGNIAGFNKVALPIVRRAYGDQLIANEIVSVQPMDLPSGLAHYLDIQYQSSKAGVTAGESLFGNYGNAATQNNQVSGFGGAQATGRLYDQNFGYSQRSFSLGTSLTAGVDGTTTTTSDKLSGSLSAIKVAVSASADLSGIPSWRLYQTIELGTDGNTFRGLSSVTSVTRDSNRRNIDYTKTQYDGTYAYFFGNATAVAAALVRNAAMTMVGPARTYLSGQTGTNNFTTQLGDYQEVAPSQIKIAMKAIPIVAQTRKLAVQWTQEMIQDLDAYHSIDGEKELTQIISDAVSLEIDRQILSDLRIGSASHAAWSRKIGNYLTITSAGVVSTVSLSANSFGSQAFYGTQTDWYQTLVETINVMSRTIQKKTLRGGATFLVVSPEIAAILDSVSKFTTDPNKSDWKVDTGIEKAGTFNKKWDVYVDPYAPSGAILLGRKGNSFFQTGYVYAPYQPLILTPVVYDPKTFVPAKGLMTRYAKQMLKPDYYAQIFVKDIRSIYTTTSLTSYRLS